MSVVNGKRQAAWFGIEPDAEAGRAASGPFAGVVFNRPVDQVFTYRVPARLARGRRGPGSGCACRWAGGTSRRSATACGSTTTLPEGVEPATGQGRARGRSTTRR